MGLDSTPKARPSTRLRPEGGRAARRFEATRFPRMSVDVDLSQCSSRSGPRMKGSHHRHRRRGNEGG